VYNPTNEAQHQWVSHGKIESRGIVGLDFVCTYGTVSCLVATFRSLPWWLWARNWGQGENVCSRGQSDHEIAFDSSQLLGTFCLHRTNRGAIFFCFAPSCFLRPVLAALPPRPTSPSRPRMLSLLPGLESPLRLRVSSLALLFWPAFIVHDYCSDRSSTLFHECCFLRHMMGLSFLECPLAS